MAYFAAIQNVTKCYPQLTLPVKTYPDENTGNRSLADVSWNDDVICLVRQMLFLPVLIKAP
jgi:hypothetical protein